MRSLCVLLIVAAACKARDEQRPKLVDLKPLDQPWYEAHRKTVQRTVGNMPFFIEVPFGLIEETTNDQVEVMYFKNRDDTFVISIIGFDTQLRSNRTIDRVNEQKVHEHTDTSAGWLVAFTDDTSPDSTFLHVDSAVYVSAGELRCTVVDEGIDLARVPAMVSICRSLRSGAAVADAAIR